jgi:hypothetical protein
MYGQRGLQRLRAEDGGARNLLGGGDVPLHLRRGEREDVPDVVEAVAGVVLREVVCRMGVHAQ